MSHDYVAILTSVDAALLLVGTLQYGVAFRRVTETLENDMQRRRARLDALFERRRQGIEPSASELLALYPSSPFGTARLLSSRRLFATLFISSAYLSWCGVLVFTMAKMFEWAGTADASGAPRLAEHSFWVTVLSLAALLLEVYLVSTFTAAGLIGSALKAEKASRTPEERQEMADLVRRARAGALDGETSASPSQGT
ncbi:hypothetical protein ACIPQH_25335 [Streptomyces rubiginosohelvolus]|uniref:hypothetical protein n=1 Tax=Streptomyces rubiginosohelvolus TaxID=67362 RepID=UPI0037FE8A1F